MNANKLVFTIIILWTVLLGSPAVVLPQTAGTTLSFSAPVSTTILDKDGQGTGFTSVQPNAAGNQYDADRIDLDTASGSLKMTATQGSNATANNLVNGLQVAADTTVPFTITARLKGPLTNLASAYQQGGIFLGTNQDNYVKFVIVNAGSGSGSLGLQFYQEQNAVRQSVGGGQLPQISGLNWASINTLDLFLKGDPATGKITASYRINSDTATPIQLSQVFQPTAPASFFAGSSTMRAGILAFTSSAPDVTVNFESFAVQYPQAVYDLALSTAPDRSGAVLLSAQEVTGDIYVFLNAKSGNGISKVSFYIDDPDRAGTPARVESLFPYDLAGTNATNGQAKPFDTRTLADGEHTFTTAVALTNGTQTVKSGKLRVANGGSCPPISTLPCSQVLVNLPYQLNFSESKGKLLDKNGVGTGFSIVDPTGKGTGYLPAKLLVDQQAGIFKITTTAGLAFEASNSQDNALAVGIDAPSQISIIGTTLVNPPAGTGNFEQAGLWFGNDQDNYLKLVVISTAGGTQIRYDMEVGGKLTASLSTPGSLNLSGARVGLELRADPVAKTISASYSLNGTTPLAMGTFTPPNDFFSFDAATIDPTIGTKSFGGIFASHRNGPAALTYSFDDFAVISGSAPPPPSGFEFTRTSFLSPGGPTGMVWGPDGRLYVAELFGTIRAFTLGPDKLPVSEQLITSLVDKQGDRLLLGIAVDPASTAGNVILWVTHSSPSTNQGIVNSAKVTRLSGTNFATIEDKITGLPRALNNHSTNSLHFGPDGKLYISVGGNTAAGAPNDAGTEFGDREEQPLSAAILVADVKSAGFDGSCENASDPYGSPPCSVVTHATGLRNSYDFVFHSNGNLYATDNGLGVTGTYPPSPTPPCLGFGDPAPVSEGGDNPGLQPDLLHWVKKGKYYGHPNPRRNECVFKDGSYQRVPPLPNWEPPFFQLGTNQSANGIIEYTAGAFCGALKNNLLTVNYSNGDDLTRIVLANDGKSVISSQSLIGGFDEPLPIAQSPDGTIFVGELSGGKVTALTPKSATCNAL
ncbi:MAG: PQQ-dependent sugar dehydrogenase [Aphanocapsa lilacina HA4352-LM1]|jgi:glucose/arabinose dehydrogenase|nr:PQQ-dependent sugar dehydrogenase [Aphanocapsa lilacina HA4352-LM1]